MLEQDHGVTTFDEEWERLPVRAPDPTADGNNAFEPPVYPCEQRKYVRLRCQGRAILSRQAEQIAVYVVDISRSGIGLITPVQLFPSELVDLSTPDREIPLRVVRCIRLGQGCYHCGCKFQRRDEPANGAAMQSVR